MRPVLVFAFACIISVPTSGQSLGPVPFVPSGTLQRDEAYKQAIDACTGPDFNKCVVATTSYLYVDRGNKGYHEKAYFTQALDWGTPGAIRSKNPPETMCVAAVAETVIEAANFYSKATGKTTPFTHLGPDSWNSMRRTDIRTYIWENEGPKERRGAGYAFEVFGMGEIIDFKQARAGDFISLDRNKFRAEATWKEEERSGFLERVRRYGWSTHQGQRGVWESSGHSTIFLGYLSKSLLPTLNYKEGEIVGFIYFSSQGAAAPNGGFGYRTAIFRGAIDKDRRLICETATLVPPKDCRLDGIERKTLRVGRLHSPDAWEKTKPSKFRAMLTKEIARSLETLVRRDLALLKLLPDVPHGKLNLPGSKDVFAKGGGEARIRAFVEEVARIELEKENNFFDAERLDGVTE